MKSFWRVTSTLWYANTSKSIHSRGVITTTTASGTMSQIHPTDDGEGYGNEDNMDDPAHSELLEFHEGGRMSEDDIMVANDEEGEDDIMAAGGDEIVDDEVEEEEESDDEESDDEDDDEGEDEDDDDGSDDSAAAKVSGVRVLAKIVWGENEE